MTGRRAGLFVVGVGARRGAPADEVLGLVRDTLREAGAAAGSVVAVATVAAKAHEPGVAAAAAALGVPLRTYPAAELARVPVPNPSAAAVAVGTPSVAEAAALAEGGELVVGKRKSGGQGRPGAVTCAIVRLADPSAPAPVPAARGAGGPGPDPRRERRRTGRTAPAASPPPQGECVTSPPALLIAADGALDDAGAEALLDFVEHLGSRHPGIPVAAGLVGDGRWPLATAVGELVSAGADRLAAVPLALAPDRRAEDALAAALDAVRGDRPGLAVTVSGAFGPGPALLALLERRLDEVLGGGARSPRDRAGVTVLLVGPGSADPQANAEVHRAARLLWEGRGYAGVETAFVSTAAPDVPAGLDRCERLGARRIVVLPYALFHGGPAERARLHAEGWAAAHPDTEVRCAEVTGPVDELVDLVVDRYREAVASPVPARAGRP